jgi:hypothetical protein
MIIVRGMRMERDGFCVRCVIGMIAGVAIKGFLRVMDSLEWVSLYL